MEERLNGLDHRGEWDDGLTTEEANSVRELWHQLHRTPDEVQEYVDAHARMDAIAAEAGSCYLNMEQNQEYMKLSARSTQLAHDVWGKRVIANHAMRDKVWPEFAPKAVRYWKLVDKPREQLTDAEAEELKDLIEWFSKLQAEALEAAESQLTKTSGQG